MGRKKMPKAKRLEVPFTVRLSSKDAARIGQLADRLPLTASAVGREALRIGLDAIEQDPARLLRPAK